MINMNLQSKRRRQVEVITCDRCNCTWLYPVVVNRYSPAPTAPGMLSKPVHFNADFSMLACAGCGRVVFPPREGFRTASAEYQLYHEMVEEIASTDEDLEAEQRKKGTTKDQNTHSVWGSLPDKRSME